MCNIFEIFFFYLCDYSLQTQFSDEDIASMLGNIGMGEGSTGGDFLPFMQQMMQSLLSKEILYPALKDIVDKVSLSISGLYSDNVSYLLTCSVCT